MARRLLPAAIIVPLLARLADAALRTARHFEFRGRGGVFRAREHRRSSWRSSGSTRRAANAPTRLRRTAERALRLSEERNQLIVETALDGVVTINAQGNRSPAGTRRRRSSSAGRAAKRWAASSPSSSFPSACAMQHRSGLHRYVESGMARVLNKRIEIVGAASRRHRIPRGAGDHADRFRRRPGVQRIRPRHHRPRARRGGAA